MEKEKDTSTFMIIIILLLVGLLVAGGFAIGFMAATITQDELIVTATPRSVFD